MFADKKNQEQEGRNQDRISGQSEMKFFIRPDLEFTGQFVKNNRVFRIVFVIQNKFRAILGPSADVQCACEGFVFDINLIVKCICCFWYRTVINF